MSVGGLAQIGSPFDLYEDPKTPFVADFNGKMYFLRGGYLGSDSAGAMVRLPGEVRIAAKSVNGSAGLFDPGKPVKIAVRPQRLRLAPCGEGGPFAIPATVEAAIFVGSFHVVVVRIPGAEELLYVQLPATGAGLAFRAGEGVDLLAEREAVRLFPAEA
ncbi:TOBE domain-containing protein [Mesorhizobium amorphae]|uniref:TOBE domain-containing protein n=1 Tax=Mesorhizobium amorphae TaxID=71433 RepID=UPI0031F55DB4